VKQAEQKAGFASRLRSRKSAWRYLFGGWLARIGILGDYNSQSETHIATDKCLALAAVNLGVDVRGE
jgi:hypothetical protein